MAQARAKRTNIFISYSHKDARWLERLRLHLKPLINDDEISVWDDTKIQPGSAWRVEIEQAIQSTKVAILLVSADFLASEFITNQEIPPLLKAAEEDGAIMLPLIINPSAFTQIDQLYRYQALNNPSRPLTSLPKSKQEEILAQAAKQITSQLKGAPQDQREKPPDAAEAVGESLAPGDVEAQHTGRMPPPAAPRRAPAQQPDAVEPEPQPRPTPPGGDGPEDARKLSPTVWAAIISGGVALVVAFLQFVLPNIMPHPVDYAGRVTNARSGKGISGAVVAVDLPAGRATYSTDSDGYFHMQAKRSTAGLHITIEAAHYVSLNRTIVVERNGTEEFRLEPISEPRTYTLKVLDVQAGRAIAGATVTVNYSDPTAPAGASPASSGGAQTLRTDREGKVRLELNVSIQSADFEVQAVRYVTLKQQNKPLTPNEDIVFSLRPPPLLPSPPTNDTRPDRTEEQFRAALNACKNDYDHLRYTQALAECTRAQTLRPRDGETAQYLRRIRREMNNGNSH